MRFMMVFAKCSHLHSYETDVSIMVYSRKCLCDPIINMNVQCRYMYYNGDGCVSPYSQNCLSMKGIKF